MIIQEKRLEITSVVPTNEPVKRLIAKLDQYQIELYGNENCHLDSADVLQKSNAYMVGAYAGESLAGIGAIKLFAEYAEIKRMFVEESFRGWGVAGNILTVLEEYAWRKGKKKIYLETGAYQLSALQLYKKLGYTVVEKFGNHTPNHLSVYFMKQL